MKDDAMMSFGENRKKAAAISAFMSDFPKPLLKWRPEQGGNLVSSSSSHSTTLISPSFNKPIIINPDFPDWHDDCFS